MIRRMRRWLEVAIDVPPSAADALSRWLIERGSPGLIEEEIDRRVRLRAHFPVTAGSRAADGRIAADLREFLAETDRIFPGCAAARLEISAIDEEDWAEGWKQGFPPLDIGSTLRIRPPWTPAGDSARHEIEIEPAMAFGTGHHGSTLGCLLALEELFDRAGALSPVLDVGTGSAILAIAAAKLGAARIVALDSDPVAVEAAKHNVARNRLEQTIAVHEGTASAAAGGFSELHGPLDFQLILANLHSGILGELAAAFAELAAPRCRLIAGGLLDRDRPALVSAAGSNGWQEEAARSIEGWTTLTFRLARPL
ncbi:MAG: 50S ribosomal protein L11 methyltransferase [Candidatus Binatia bacterium]